MSVDSEFWLSDTEAVPSGLRLTFSLSWNRSVPDAVQIPWPVGPVSVSSLLYLSQSSSTIVATVEDGVTTKLIVSELSPPFVPAPVPALD